METEGESAQARVQASVEELGELRGQAPRRASLPRKEGGCGNHSGPGDRPGAGLSPMSRVARTPFYRRGN